MLMCVFHHNTQSTLFTGLLCRKMNRLLEAKKADIKVQREIAEREHMEKASSQWEIVQERLVSHARLRSENTSERERVQGQGADPRMQGLYGLEC